MLAYANIPETRKINSVVIVDAFECTIDIATELLSLKHGRKWIVCCCTDKDFNLATLVGNCAECPLIAVTE